MPTFTRDRYLNSLAITGRPFRAGRRVHALRDAAGALRSTGERRLRALHRAVLRRDRSVQRERPGDRGDRGGPLDLAGAAVAIQEHHHPQQHREIHRGVLDIRDRRRPLAPHLRANLRGDAVE